MFQESSKVFSMGGSRNLQRGSSKFQGFFKEGFKEVSRVFCQNIIGISRVFQRCFKENSCFFSGCSMFDNLF